MKTPSLSDITWALQRLTGCSIRPTRDLSTVLADLPIGPGRLTTLMLTVSPDGRSMTVGPEDGAWSRKMSLTSPALARQGRRHYNVAEKIIASTVARTVGRRRDAAAVVDAIAGVPGLPVSPPPPMPPGDTRRAVATVRSRLHGTQVVVADTDEGDVALISRGAYDTTRAIVGAPVRTPLDVGRAAATLLRLVRSPEAGETW